jgi:branched-chain amino acid transport system substrate-binding protein
MRTRGGRRFLSGASVVAAGVVFAACSTGVVGGQSGAGAATSSTTPGVTSTSVKVAVVASQTSIIGYTTFGPFITGEKAYFSMVNAQGGVNGRKITLAWNYTTGLTDSKFTSLIHQVVDADHAFAVGISSYNFTPAYLKQTGIPTYGWNVVGNWTGPKNLFASGGSVQFYTALPPQVAYLMQKTKTSTVGILALNVGASAAACTNAAKKLPKYGVKVGYENLKVTVKALATTVQRMRSKGVNFVLSCMETTNNITLSSDLQRYGVKATQYWLDGGTVQLYKKYPSQTTGVYIRTTSVPFTLPPKVAKYYPGLKKYLTSMKKYPKYKTSQTALNGWASAALLVAGLKAAGKNPTQQGVVQATNKLSFDATGMQTVTHWTVAHTKAPPPYCTAFVQVQKSKLVTKFMRGHQVFTCFTLKNTTPVKAAPGTPGTT